MHGRPSRLSPPPSSRSSRSSFGRTRLATYTRRFMSSFVKPLVETFLKLLQWKGFTHACGDSPEWGMSAYQEVWILCKYFSIEVYSSFCMHVFVCVCQHNCVSGYIWTIEKLSFNCYLWYTSLYLSNPKHLGSSSLSRTHILSLPHTHTHTCTASGELDNCLSISLLLADLVKFNLW